MPSIHALLSWSASWRSLASLPVEDLLLAGRAAFLVFSFVVAAITFTRWRRAAERDTAHTAGQMALVLERLERLEMLAARSEPRLAALAEQLELHLNAASGSAQMSYPIAIRLARAGAEPQELISSCGLTRQEAELVARLHGRSGGAAGAQGLSGGAAGPQGLSSRNHAAAA